MHLEFPVTHPAHCPFRVTEFITRRVGMHFIDPARFSLCRSSYRKCVRSGLTTVFKRRIIPAPKRKQGCFPESRTTSLIFDFTPAVTPSPQHPGRPGSNLDFHKTTDNRFQRCMWRGRSCDHTHRCDAFFSLDFPSSAAHDKWTSTHLIIYPFLKFAPFTCFRTAINQSLTVLIHDVTHRCALACGCP